MLSFSQLPAVKKYTIFGAPRKMFGPSYFVTAYYANLLLSTLISLIANEVGINMEGGIFWNKLAHKCNKRGVEGGKNLRNQ